MEELQKKYVIKSFNSKSSRQKKLKFEEIDLSVYKSSAKCAAFVTSEDRILFWVKALQESYFDLLEDNDDYHIKWIDHLNSDDSGFEHIEMKVSRFTAVPDNRTTLFTITTYLTTGVVMCQGISFELWCSNEFPRLKEKTERYYSLYHGSAATCDQGFATCTPEERKTIITHLEEAFQIASTNRKSKALKDCTNIPLPPDENWSEDEGGPHIPGKDLASEIPKTPVPLHRKRRNSLDSPRGLSVRSKASISDLKTVAASLESDLAEVKTELSNVKATHDLCASKFGVLQDKITQLDNDYKVQIKLLSSRLIDVETTNEHLQSENTKLKTEMQNLKKNLKALDKKIETIENEKKLSIEEKNHTKETNIPICQQSSNGPSETGWTQHNTLTNNPFHVVTTIEHEDDNPHPNGANTQHTHSNRNNPQLNDNIHSSGDTPEQKSNTHPSGNNPNHNHHIHPRETTDTGRKGDIILLMDSNGKFIDPKKFSTTSVVQKFFSPTIASAIDLLSKEHFGTPSAIVIHTGTNDVEKSPLDACFEHFQTLIDIAAQSYPGSKVVISSLLVRNDTFDTQRSQLNSRLGRLRSYPNVHFVNNETITRDMLHDQKHVKRRKIGVLVSNLKDCTFNRISKRPYMMLNTETTPKQNPAVPKLNHHPAQSPLHQQPRFFADQSAQSPSHQQPRLFAEVVKSSRNHFDSAVDHETMLKLLNIYEMIRQS